MALRRRHSPRDDVGTLGRSPALGASSPRSPGFRWTWPGEGRIERCQVPLIIVLVVHDRGYPLYSSNLIDYLYATQKGSGKDWGHRRVLHERLRGESLDSEGYEGPSFPRLFDPVGKGKPCWKTIPPKKHKQARTCYKHKLLMTQG